MALSQKQIRAADLLARGYSQEEAGKAVGASRRSISRWLQEEDFRNLSYGLVGRVQSPPQPVQPPLQRSPERRQQSSGLTTRLTPKDLVEDALVAVRDILNNPEARTCDRLKAASLIGDWAGLSLKKPPMHEMEGLEALIQAGWVPDEVLDALIESSNDMGQTIKNAFHNCFENGNKKSLSQENEEGTVDVDFDDDDFDELE
jgi:ParB-like chromosome segregation protein Spo0J